MSAIKLYVIGDSHAAFWKGSSVRFGRRQISEIETVTIAESFSAPAVVAALPPAYDGWVLLTFGDINYADEIWRKAQEVGFADAVRSVAERYAGEILAIKQAHQKLAVWGPPAAANTHASAVTIGNTIERNLALVSLTALLKTLLAPQRVPVLSVIDDMLAPDGTTLPFYFEDCMHLSQAVMPTALRLLQNQLAVDIDARNVLLGIAEQRVTKFASVERVVHANNQWTEFCLPGEVRFITEVVIPRDRFAPLVQISIATTIDGSAFPSNAYQFHGPLGEAREVVALPVMAYAKKILLWAEQGYVEEHDVDIFERVSPLSNMAHYTKASMLALRDEILPTPHAAVISNDGTAKILTA